MNLLPNRIYPAIVSFAALALYGLLYTFRSVDNNTLTSWRWSFLRGPYPVLLMLVLGLVLAYLISGWEFKFRRHYPVIIGLFSFAASAMFWPVPEVIVDSSRYFSEAKHLEIYGIGYFLKEWGRGISAWTDLPLMPFLYGLVFRIFGETRLLVQVLNSILFSLSTLLTYRVGKALWDEETGIFAGLFLLGIPYLFTQVPLMLVDVATMFFLLLSVFSCIKALREGGWSIPLAALSIFFAMLVKYSAWLMLSVALPVYLIHMRKEKVLLRAAEAVLFAVALFGVVFILKYDVFIEQISLLLSYQRLGLKGWQEGYVSTFLYQVHPFITILAVFSVFAALKRKDFKYMVPVWLVLLVFALGIKRIRYIIMVFPMLALMASYGLRAVRDKRLRKFIALCVLISSIIIASAAYMPFLKRVNTVNLKEAGRFLDSLDVNAVEVYALPQKDSDANTAVFVPILDYFTKKNIKYYNNYINMPLPAEVGKSPLRFTWETNLPPYYARHAEGRTAIVIISSEPPGIIPEDIKAKTKGLNTRVFATNEGVFRLRAVVTVFYGI